MHKRILILGTTGTNKRDAINKCETKLREAGHEVRIIDFEKDFLPKDKNFRTHVSYLNKPLLEQANIWDNSWRLLADSLDDSVTILLLHGTIVRSDFGPRIAINIEAVAENFQPSLIITLIDDLYNCWQRTEQRAGGEASKGQPTLEQLLMARRTEAMLGDAIFRRTDAETSSPKHIMLSVHHPVSTLTNLILHEAKVAYLSFPISAPRGLLAGSGDLITTGKSVIGAINNFHKKALATQVMVSRIVFISPLAIDELPFVKAIKAADGEDQFAFAVKEQRWPIKDLWGDVIFLSDKDLDTIQNIPYSMATNVEGLLKTDVGWRDYRLVEQSDFIACYSPVVPRVDGTWRPARGVYAELQKALARQVQIYVFQEPGFDPENTWPPGDGSGTMGLDTMDLGLENKESLDALFEAIAQQV